MVLPSGSTRRKISLRIHPLVTLWYSRRVEWGTSPGGKWAAAEVFERLSLPFFLSLLSEEEDEADSEGEESEEEEGGEEDEDIDAESSSFLLASLSQGNLVIPKTVRIQ